MLSKTTYNQIHYDNKRFINHHLFIWVIFFSSYSQSKADSSIYEHPLLIDKIESYVKEQENKGFKGTVLVAKNNEIILNKAIGDSNLTTNSVFYIASVTKQFTATAILKLQEQGKLLVNDPIAKFIDEVPLDKKGITIHHLLTHTSGLANNYVTDGIKNRQEAINVILSSHLDYNVGEKYSYSAEGYNLLAIIIELVSGETYENYISQNLLAPSNLNHTGFWGYEGNNTSNIASFNNLKTVKSLSRKVYHKGVSIANYGYKGGTGIFSTSQDLYKWINTIKYSDFLSPKSIQQLFKPYKNLKGNIINGVSYAYGWRVEYKNGELTQIRHGGLEDGIHDVYVRSYTNGEIIIVFSNSGVYKGKGKFNGKECWSIVLSMGLQDILEKNKIKVTAKK